MSRADELDPNASLEEWLAYDVRRFREEHGMTQQELARKLRISFQLMCNLEANRRRFRREHVEALDELWDAKGHFVRLWIHSRREHDREWFRKYTVVERRARVIKFWQPLSIPGLFQSADYIRAMTAAARASDADEIINTRLERQEQILGGENPPQVYALIDEKALRQPVPGVEKMRAQLGQLLEIAALPHVTVQVVPMRARGHVGIDGGFVVLDLGREDGQVGYIEAQLTGRIVRDEDEVATLALRYDDIRAQALSEDQSADLIRTIMEDMR
jgi:transcriptional regulator with XRE-family HTH domain